MGIPFDGKPYIFVSYSHNDEAFVKNLINQMSDLGYRIWYDGDLPHTRDYNDIIANAIINCSVFLAVLSVSAVESEYVLDELFLARNREKNIIASFIDDCAVPPGMEMRIGRLNHLYYNPSNHYKFIESICDSCKSCRSEAKNEKQAVSEPDKVVRKIPHHEVSSAEEPAEGNEDLAHMSIMLRLAQEESADDAQNDFVSYNALSDDPSFCSAEDQYCMQHFSFRSLSDNELEIQRCILPESKMHIPFKYKNKRITSIGDSAFKNCTALKSIDIPISIKRIGFSAFSRCTNLTSILLPKSITAIQDETFYECDNLSSVVLPYNISDIGRRAFYGCKKLKSIALPKGLQAIGESAFGNCVSLSLLTLPDNLQMIGKAAFERCEGLIRIHLPKSLRSIGKNAFYQANVRIIAPKYALSYGYIPDMGTIWDKK